MNDRRLARILLPCCMMLSGAFAGEPAFAHGGVVLEEDLCVINIGYFKAHFKIYLPRERQHEEFCEDIPLTGESVFVMEYLHAGLGEVLIDFRVIRNVTGLGRFARWEDVTRLQDLEEATVLYHPPAVVPGVFSVLHEFDSPGEFIGVVTAELLDGDTLYTAVFPFEVGFTGFGYWPLLVVLALLVQANLWYLSGGLSRWRERRAGTRTAEE